ncbi:MAG: hypothetical protein ABJO09_13835 [Hyphomicrobiales bacterium]
MARFVFMCSCLLIVMSSALVMAQLDGKVEMTGYEIVVDNSIDSCMKTRNFCGKL